MHLSFGDAEFPTYVENM